MALQLDIRLKRPNKVYHENEIVNGVIRLECPSEYRHDGITLTMDATVHLKLSPKNIGVFDTFYGAVKPLQLAASFVEISAGSKMPSGVTEIPFEIPLVPRHNRVLYETYHGVYINIHYKLKCDVRRSFLAKDIFKEVEFVVEYNKDNIKDAAILNKMKDSSVEFSISPDSLRNVLQSQVLIPAFLIKGSLYETICDISAPLTGELTIKQKESTVKSIELQLVRVETCGCAEGFARECTEIQNIQIAEGDVPIGVKIPIYMVFPRLFSCPTLITTNFKIEFEINLIIIFADNHLVTENFPIITVRK